jgi:hypothetical protein
MRHRLILLVLLLSSCYSTPTGAALLAYEGFDYAAPQRVLGRSNLNTDTTWLLAAAGAAAGDTTAINVASGSLTPPAALQPAVGNSATITGSGNLSGAANRLAFNPAGAGATTGTVYYSMSLRIDDLAGSNAGTGAFIAGLNNTGNAATGTNPSAVAARLQAHISPSDSSKYELSIVRNRPISVVGDIPSWSAPLTVGDTIFIVASIEIVAGAGNDVARLWINPDPTTFNDPLPPPATITDASGGGTDIGIASFLLRQGPAPQATVDEIRIGTDWKSVVTIPEPATWGLMLISCGGFTWRRRCARR